MVPAEVFAFNNSLAATAGLKFAAWSMGHQGI